MALINLMVQVEGMKTSERYAMVEAIMRTIKGHAPDAQVSHDVVVLTSPDTKIAVASIMRHDYAARGN